MAETPASKKQPSTGDGTPAAKRRRQYGSQIVTLKTGDGDAATVTVHEALLQDNSEFFRAALEKQWKEGRTRTIRLPDSFDVVAGYIDYLYSKTVEFETAEDDQQRVYPRYRYLGRLYCFDEKILDHDFCDSVLSAMIKSFRDSSFAPGFEAAEIIYAGTPTGSIMREFMVFVLARFVSSKWRRPPICSELAHDVIVEMSKLRGSTYLRATLDVDKEKWMKVKPEK